MKDVVRQIAVGVSIVVTLVINTLANALPINGLNTGEISDRFKVYFVPAGYVFSIWGLIYIGLIAYGIYQALPSQRDNPRLRAAGWWAVLSGLANSTWIFLWHYEQFPLTILAMLTLLVSLIVIYARLGINRQNVSSSEKWMVHLPFSIYLGWITVATVANVTDVLYYAGWDGFGIAPEIWMVIMLGAVLLITAAMLITRRDAAYTAVILWALVGIAVKHAQMNAVAVPTWVVFGLVAVLLGWALLIKKPPLLSRPA